MLCLGYLRIRVVRFVVIRIAFFWHATTVAVNNLKRVYQPIRIYCLTDSVTAFYVAAFLGIWLFWFGLFKAAISLKHKLKSSR